MSDLDAVDEKMHQDHAHVDLAQLTTLVHLWETTCAIHAERAAYVQMGSTITYRQLDNLSRAFAAWLQDQGLKKGDRLAIMMPNVLQYPIAMLGALRAGLVVVNTNPLYTARELEGQLTDSGAKAVVILENFAHVLQEVIARTQVRTVLVTSVGDLLGRPKSWIVNYVVRHQHKQVRPRNIPGALRFTEVLALGEGLAFSRPMLTGDDVAFLQYTSGTTGGPKGAMLTHRNICSNVLQCEAWLDHRFDEPSVLLTALPLYHIFALTINCLVFLRLGWKNILIANPRDCPRLVAEIRRHRFAFITGVNTLFKALLNTPGFEKVDFSHLKIALAGGMALEAEVAARWKSLTRTELTQAWGLTETSPGACINPCDAQFNSSVGKPIPCTEISIKDDRGADLETGFTGEICVRGPQVMAGYWNRPDETAATMFPDGWLRTGDIGRIDNEGFVYLQDRKKDMIVVSGFKVFSNEVEAAALLHPAVLEVAAIAQDDMHSGEAVSIHVIRKDTSLSETDLIEHCRKYLTAYKTPKYVYFRTELPKTNLGKVSKHALRHQLIQEASL